MGANKTDAFHRLGERSLPGADHENRLRVDCAGCLARRTCLLACAPAESFQGLHPLVYVRLRLRRGESLFRAWDSFSALYTIRSGFFKTTLLYADGREQVAGFYMAGETLGLNAIAPQVHITTATALEDGEVCAVPFLVLEQALLDSPVMQRRFHKVMAEEIVREQAAMMLLGSFDAEGRLAGFLLNLSYRYASLGYSAEEFNLRMSREELGSYLGLTLETVSRTLSKMHEAGLVAVNLKRLRILDMKGLKRILGRERQPPQRLAPLPAAQRASKPLRHSLRSGGKAPLQPGFASVLLAPAC